MDADTSQPEKRPGRLIFPKGERPQKQDAAQLPGQAQQPGKILYVFQVDPCLLTLVKNEVDPCQNRLTLVKTGGKQPFLRHPPISAKVAIMHLSCVSFRFNAPFTRYTHSYTLITQ